MDRTRLDASIAGMSAAETAYASALRRQAAATRAARADATLAGALQDANAELAAARVAVSRARTDLDHVREAELAGFQTPDQLLGLIPGGEVLGLFPVGVEARLEPSRLRLRVWPDAISTATHDPRLTEAELAAAKRYWRAVASAGGETQSTAAWPDLADAIGVVRAAWAAQLLTPINAAMIGPTVEPEFPIVPLHDDEAPFVPRAGVLPDRWIAIGIREGQTLFEQVGAAIPLDLAVGLDTTPAETAALANREGEPIQLPPRMRWMTDFTLAVEAGMAFDIPLAADVDRLDELFVLGVRVTQTPAQNATALESLFTGHRFSRGLAFVPQDTPTNNSGADGSGMPSRSERMATAFAVERQPRVYPDGLDANGSVAARAFGIAPDVLAPAPHAGAATPDAEPEGFESEAARAMQTVLWQVTVGAAMEDFLLLPNARAEALRTHFREHVRAAGPISAMRIGRQPYGVLPATTIDGFVAQPGEQLDAQLLPLLRAARSWFGMRRMGALFEGSTESALRYLGRSAHLFAETTQQVAGNTAPNRWQTLAWSLAVSSRNSIQDTWRNVRITGTVEGVPAPMERDIVDATTASEFASLATALPIPLLDAAVPESVLARIARQATLLEWTRFARTAVEAAVDIPSRQDLAAKAAQGGNEIYLRVLANAFRPTRPMGPEGPVGPVRDLEVGRESAVSPEASPDLARRRNDAFPEHPDIEDPPVFDPDSGPEGDPAVGADEEQRIRALVGNSTQPLLSCPGAERLASFRAMLARLAQFPAARLESEFFGALDLCNHRLDAWFTSLATQRLSTLRATNPLGIVTGGWGCLQGVRRADALDPAQQAEFIHAPSLDQAAAAAVLRSGARRAQAGGSDHADIDLSSRRVRLARWILEGIRNGRSLSELLGARFERTLKGTPAEAQLEQLRTRFPGFAGKGVLDGLRLHAELSTEGDTPVTQAAAAVDATIDAVADALTAEAVYQIVRGNPGGALVNLQALADGAPPPQLRVSETPQAGIRLTHRVVIALPATAVAPGWRAAATPRSAAEPLLDAWCGLLLGPAADTVLTVDGANGGTETVTLAALGIGAIDVVFGGRGDGAELAARLVRVAAHARSELATGRVRTDRAWKDLAGLCNALARVLAQAQPLRSDSFDPPSALATAAPEDFDDLPARVAAASAALTAVRDELRSDPAAALPGAAAFGIMLPDALPGIAPTTEQQAALLAAIESRLADAADGTARERLRALFGGDLPGVTTFTPRNPEMLVTAASPPASLLDGQAQAPSAWLDAAGRTHRNVATFAEVLLRRDIATGGEPAPLRIAQAPWKDGDRWIGTAFTSASGAAPAGRLSVLIHAPAGFASDAPLGGLLVDAWTETIPAAKRDTAMALRFNNAGTRAPQAVLLAVHPDPSHAWTTTTLVEILQQTLLLTRLRMLPPTTFSTGGLMPFAWLGQRPGSGLSFDL